MKKTENKTVVADHLTGKFIVIIVAATKYVIPLEFCSEIITVLDITPSPQADDWIRGIITLRDKIMTLIDTRKRLGLPSQQEEFEAMLDKGRDDHNNNIKVLETLIKDKEEINFPTDPNACGFGKWLNQELLDRNLNADIKKMLQDVAIPHGFVHATVGVCKDLCKNKKYAEALKKVDEIKFNAMPMIEKYLTELKIEYAKRQRRELALILEYGDSNLAILADKIDTINTFEPSELQKGSLTNSKMINGVYHNDKDEIFQEINIQVLLDNTANNAD